MKATNTVKNITITARSVAGISGACILFLAGCAHPAGSPFNPLVYRSAFSSSIRNTEYIYDSKSKIEPNYFQKVYDNPPPNKTRRMVRDEIVYELIAVIDESFDRWANQIRGADSTAGALQDMALTGITAYGAASGGLTQALSGVSTALTGLDAKISSHYLQSQSMEAVLAQMDTDRADKKAKIYNQITGSGVDSYPLARALVDIGEYYHDASLYKALQELTAKTTTDSKTAKDNVPAAGSTTNDGTPSSAKPGAQTKVQPASGQGGAKSGHS